MPCQGPANPNNVRRKYYNYRSDRRVDDAKKKARSELNKCGWTPHQYAYNNYIERLKSLQIDTIERIDVSQLTVEQFRERYEKPGIPVILSGAMKKWKANEKWTVDKLYKKYRNQKFKCGEDDDGYSVKLKMKYYTDYMTSTMDDSPLYIFDSGFGDRKKTNAILSDYEVPEFFKDDLFRYASERRRPPYRWFVMGPERSGTSIHVDPLGTSAWNGLVSGEKRWCLIHPSAPRTYVKPRKDEVGKHPDEAVTWFRTVFPRVVHDKLYPSVFATQKAGDLMFVPSGWWHVVINTDITLAITQNFCSLVNLPEVWRQTIKGRPQFAKHWLRCLKKERPEVVDSISRLDLSRNWNEVADDMSSDSSSSSSSESDTDSDDSGAETEEHGERKRPFTSNGDGNVINPDMSVEPCPSKLKRSPQN